MMGPSKPRPPHLIYGKPVSSGVPHDMRPKPAKQPKGTPRLGP